MPKGKRKQILLVFIIMITAILVWDETSFNELETGDNPFLIPQVKLSSLPEDISKSLLQLEDKALARQTDINKEKHFSLDIVSFSRQRIISASTPLIIQTYYKDSNKLVQRVTSMPDSFVGLSISELRELAQEWQVKEGVFDKALVLYRELNESNDRGVNKEDSQVMYLGIKDGRVAIFKGSSGNQLNKITDIPAKNLPQKEREMLEKGLIVYSQEELISILEGLVEFNLD